ncbi:MAG: hypothetical protein ACT4OX_10860 [Actinomycetota bacterium]
MRVGQVFAAGVLGVAAVGLGPVAPAGAASTAHTDPAGDNDGGFATGDIVGYSLTSDATTVTMSVTTAAFVDPSTDAGWVDLFSRVDFTLWLPGDNASEVLLYNTGSEVVATAYDADCDATPSWNAGARTYTATIPASCLGYPRQLYMSVEMAYETDSSTGYDDAANTGVIVVSGRDGYWMVTSTGTVYAFGLVAHHGDGRPVPGTKVVDLEPTPSGNGYWLLTDDGDVFAHGDAEDYGRAFLPEFWYGERATAISRTPAGDGYWIFTDLGRAIELGDAEWFGDMTNVRLNGPVLDAIPTPSGLGYYMVGSDGGIFAFGDAAFYGSMGGKRLNAPVMSLVPDPDGRGYWLVATDGGVFAFEAGFRGSMGGRPLNRAVTGMVPFGSGYLMVGEDGGIFNFSDKPFLGSLGSSPPSSPVVSVAAA